MMRTQSKLTSRKRKRMKSAKSRPSKRANICLRRVASIIVIASMIFAGHKQVVSAAKLECRHQNQGANQARQAPARLDTMTSQPRPLEAPFVATSSASGLNEKTTAQATATTSALEPAILSPAMPTRTRPRALIRTRRALDEPVSRLVGLAGQTLELECPLTSSRSVDPTSIEWRKDGSPLAKLNPRLKVDGRNASLIISAAQVKLDEGIYECTSSSQESVGKGPRFELQLLVAPRLAPFEFASDAQVGMRVLLTCSALEGHQPISFIWLKDGRPIVSEHNQAPGTLSDLHRQQLSAKLAEPSPGRRLSSAASWLNKSESELSPIWDPGIRIRQSDDYAILSIEKLGLGHAGRYTCSAQNEAARASHSAQLSINAPPTLSVEPKDADLVSGQSALLNCQAQGQPRPTVSWLRARETNNKQWEYLPVYDSSRYTNLANGSLAMANVSQREQGFYLCSAGNGFGPEVTKLIKITVHEPARFAAKYRTVEVRFEERANMVCLANGEPPIAIQWFERDGKQILSSDKRYIIDQNNSDDLKEAGEQSNATASRLIITRATRTDSGHYTCQATNKHGSDKTVTNLLVQDVPDKVTDLKVTNVTSSTASIRWQLGFTGNSPVTSYLVQYQSDDPLDDLLLTRSPTNDQLAGVNQIKAALEGLGLSQSLDGQPDEAIDRTLVELTVEQSASNLVVKDLSPFCVYRLRIAAINKIGLGEFSDWIRAQTEEAPPSGSALRISASATGPNSIKLTWSPPERRTWNGKLLAFNIGYRPLDSSFEFNKTVDWSPPSLQSLVLDESRKQLKQVATNSTANSESLQALRQQLRQLLAVQQQELVAHLTNLQRSTTYLIWIQPINNRGLGPQSHSVSVKTLDDVPPSAPSIKIQSSTPNSITLTWSLLSNFVSSANQYSLFYRKLAPGNSSGNSDQQQLAQQSFVERTISGQQLLASSSGNLFEGAFAHQQFVYTLDQLECGSAYELYMTTRNSVGKSEPSALVSTRTIGQAPVAPVNKGGLFARIGSSEVALNLAAWSTGGCPLTHVGLRYRQAPLPVAAASSALSSASRGSVPEDSSGGSSPLGGGGAANFNFTGWPSTWPMATSVPASLLVAVNAQRGLSSPSTTNSPSGQLKADLMPIYTLKGLSPSTCYELEVVAQNAAGSTFAQYEFVTASQNGTRAGYSRREGVYKAHADQHFEEHQASLANQTAASNQWISLTLVMLCFVVCLLLSLTFCYFRLADSWKSRHRRRPSSDTSAATCTDGRSRVSTPHFPTSLTLGKAPRWRAAAISSPDKRTVGSPTRTLHYCMQDTGMAGHLFVNTLKPKLCMNGSTFTQSVSMKDFSDPQTAAPNYSFRANKVDFKAGTMHPRLHEESPFVGGERPADSLTSEHEQPCPLYACKQNQDTYISALNNIDQGQNQPLVEHQHLHQQQQQQHESTQYNSTAQNDWTTHYGDQAAVSNAKTGYPQGAYAVPTMIYSGRENYNQAAIDACIQQLINQQQQQQNPQNYAMIVNHKPELDLSNYGSQGQNFVGQCDEVVSTNVPNQRAVSTNCGQSVMESSSSSSGIDVGTHLDCMSTTTRTSNSNESQSNYQIEPKAALQSRPY